MSRLWIVLALLFGVYAAVAVRLAQLQLILHRSLAEKSRSEVAQKQRVRPLRGRILDAHGRVLAVTVERPSISISLKELDVSRQGAAKKLSAVLTDVPAREIAAKLNPGAKFVWVKRLASPEEGRAAAALGIKGVGVTMESKRFYPYGEMGRGLLGAVGIDGDGTGGLEAKLDPLLQGREEVKVVLRDALGKIFAESSGGLSSGFFRGGQDASGPFDVYLTLDARLQAGVEQRLEETVLRHDAVAGMVIVEDIPTGAILAMASSRRGDSSGAMGLDPNLAASLTFEPGSVVKPFVLAAALANGAIEGSETIDCEGGRFRPVPGLTVQDHEPKNMLHVGEVLAHSSNVGFAKIGLKVGAPGLYHVYRAFGFGSKTALPVTGEAVGIVRPAEDWGPFSVPMVSFGYEIGVTALQLTQAYAALGLQGTLLEPQIVSMVTPHRLERALFTMSPRRIRDALDPKIARRTLGFMEEVVLYGTGIKAAMAGYAVAGKTGTAQKINPQTRKHTQHHVVVSFCGVMPMPDPKLAICAILDDPRKPKVAWGSDLAAPLFKSTAEEAVAILGIQPATDSSARAPQ
ncbi:MAG: penicillin-binding protein 2 [Elusimicrobia bacterium]|nr:penicillin-binding protein 2 [Elusimicrobiota bacterium]